MKGLFGGGGGGGASQKPGPPKQEVGGIDVNLISANKHESGGGKVQGGGSGFLGNLPGLGQFKGLFSAQTSTEEISDGAADSRAMYQIDTEPSASNNIGTGAPWL